MGDDAHDIVSTVPVQTISYALTLSQLTLTQRAETLKIHP